MALTPAQLATFKADIEANTNQTVIDALAIGNNNGIKDWYNLDVSPDYWIFRSFVSSDEIRTAIDAQDIADITAADSDRVVKLLSIRSGAGTGGADIGFSGENARDISAWDDVFSAASGDNSQQAIALLWQRIANNAEKVFKLDTGTGADSSNPDTTSFQGDITLQDVRDALALP